MDRWVAQSPAHPAIVDAATGTVVSYAALEDRAGRLARVLSVAGGVRAGDRVALLAHDGPETFETLGACARLGAILVPLGHRLAPPELVAMAQDCRPAVLIYDAALAPVASEVADAVGVRMRIVVRGPGGGGPTSSYETELAGAPSLPARSRRSDDPAMILYTSGTTGRPKGAVLSWGQIEFNADTTVERCMLSDDDRVLGVLPLYHTGGINCLALPALRAGGTVVLMRHFDPDEALDLCERRGVTGIVAVPTMYERLLAAGLARSRRSRLRCLLVGGAPTPLTLIEAYAGLGLRLRQGYGSTEVGPNCFTFGTPDRPGSVGRPVPGTHARVVAEDGTDAGDGEVGELWLSGPHVTTGYWENPDETAAVLSPDGWFRTGDHAQRDPEGLYYIVGRTDDMFISGGENVYPAEVEHALAEHPDVAEASVIGVPDARWNEVGLAALVARPGRPRLDADELRLWTRERLARYKVPVHWRVVESLPKNAAGKVQKDRLRALLRPVGNGQQRAFRQ